MARQNEELHPLQQQTDECRLGPVVTEVVGHSDAVTCFLCCGDLLCMPCHDANQQAELQSMQCKSLQMKVTGGQCMMWVHFFEDGKFGKKVDMQKSLQWHHRAAKKGDLWAMNSLGGMCLHGKDGLLEPSVSEGEHWLKEAADRGSAKAQKTEAFKCRAPCRRCNKDCPGRRDCATD